MSNPDRRITVILKPNVTQIVQSDFIPSTSSIGSAATAVLANTAVSASFAETASFVGAGNVFGVVASASHALRADVADSGTGSFTGSFTGDGSGLTGVVAESTQSTANTASYVAGENVDGAVQLADTASLILGSGVAGAVALADTGSYVAGSSVDGIVGSATTASGVAYDDVTAKPELVSASIQVDHDATTNFDGAEHYAQSAIAEVGTVVAGNVDAILPVGVHSSSAQISGQLGGGVTGSFTGTFVGDGSGLTGIAVSTASYVAGNNVDGIVESATTASDVAYNDVRDKPTIVSSSGQVNHDATANFDGDEHFVQGAIAEVGTVVAGNVDAILPAGLVSESAQLSGQINVTGVTGSFVGNGAGIDSVVSVSHAAASDAAVLAVSAVTALTASSVNGSNVLGPVAELDGTATGTLTGSFIGGVNLTDNSNMVGAQFTHPPNDLGDKSADFTISLDEGNYQRFRATAALQFFISNTQAGGYYAIEIENSGAFAITLPPNIGYGDSGTLPVITAETGSVDFIGFQHAVFGTMGYAIRQNVRIP